MTRRIPRDTTPRCDSCGWVGKTTTADLAGYSLRRHSCDKHRRLQAMAARVAERAADNGQRRDCQHIRSHHEHGTRNAYVCDRCRCRACKDAAREYEATRTRLALYGRWEPYVDAQPARDHVRALQTQGLGWKRIAHLAGLDDSVMWKLLYGDPSRNLAPSKRVRAVTAEKILAVTFHPDLLGARRPVDGTGTRRRLQALVCLGWSQSKLATRIGMLPTNVTRVVVGPGDVSAGTARTVRALYDELWDQPPPEDSHRDRIAASRARNRARALGWAPPMAWDDDHIDDPAATPDLGARARAAEALAENWVELAGQGYTREHAAQRLGVTRAALEMAIRRSRIEPKQATA